MALSKVLQKMAEKHKKSESNPPITNPEPKESSANGAAGILLTLLTEKQQQQKNQQAPPPPGVSNPKDSEPEQTENDPSSEGPKDSPIKEPGRTAASVLMQLLQKRKAKASETESSDKAEGGTDTLDVVGESNDGHPSPIVIEPIGANKEKREGASNENPSAGGDTGQPSSPIPPITERSTPSPSSSSSTAQVPFLSTMCKLCNRGFWDREKYLKHMKEEHDSDMQEPGDTTSDPSGASTLTRSIKVANVTPPSPEDCHENTGLRRSKRKRRPTRKNYLYEEEDEAEDNGLESETQPKIICVEGNYLSDADKKDQTTLKKSGPASETGLSTCGTHDASPRSMVADEAEAGEDREETMAVETMTSFRCSKCSMYFNSHEHMRKHLRHIHNILTVSMPPKTSPGETTAGSNQSVSQSYCETCGCHSNSKKPSTRPLTCLICGNKAMSGFKNFINIFKGRTWSSRYHQLARRLTKTFGCKFTSETCHSKHACIQCVSNLETIEKARLLKSKMAAALKRTKLVRTLEGDNVRDSHAGHVSSPPGLHAAPVPAAPLVRELLSAPEVVLPSNQFSELIDAIGSDKDSVTSSFTAASAVIPTTVTQALCTESRSSRRRGKKVTASQHDDVAFNDFVNQLQGHNSQSQHEATSSSEYNTGEMGEGGSHMGRVLAVVKVKEEPGTESERPHGSPSRSNKTSSEIYKRLTSNKQGSHISMLDPNNSQDEFRSSYTKLQIDSQSGQTEYNCVLCNNAFYSEEAIQVHVRCHTPGTKALHCFLCGFNNNLLPSQWRIMKRHLELEHNFPENYFHRFPCPVNGCADVFKCHKELVTHVSKIHRNHIKHAQGHALSDLGLFDFPCPMCGTLLQSEAALEVHILCHNGSPKYYQCYYCSYMHNSQPGSWRIMRGHLTKEHIGKELASDTFSYYECPYYACRLKFCSKKAQIVHRACHDETKDGEFFCFHCHFSVPLTPYLWEKVKEHIIARHPEMVGESFRCTCKAKFNTYREFFTHMVQAGKSMAYDP